ncbi:hypothetical protein BGZ88_008963 [Linnemannia elongata]|nr:hypothetical protein BGZ88_008963 [Linnemannia elongata]
MTKEDDPQEPVQALRSVIKNFPPSAIPPPNHDDIFHVDTIVDPKTQKRVVLWDDILQAFEDAVLVRHKSRVIPFLKGDDLRILEPRRLEAIPNIVLDVVVVDPSTDTKAVSPANVPKETASVPLRGEEIDVRTIVVTQTQETTSDSEVRRNPVYGLENTAMDNYSHIDHPAFAPPSREPQALLDNRTPTIKDLPVLPHSSNDRGFSSGAPQIESATTKASEDMDLVQLGILGSQGNKDAQTALGDRYKSGEGVQQDYQAAMDWYLQAANQGDANGLRKVGILYHEGLGVSQSYSTALEWYIKAADQGDPGAQSNIGHMYADGEGVEKDFAKAIDWYRRAADQGLANAQFNIGFMYNKGRGVSRDFAKAMEWFRMAADQGDAGAQYRIGIMYDQAKGVSQDFAKAMEWFRMAADQGHADAQNKIGIMYNKGHGVPQDFAKAMEWFRKAADQGHAYAPYHIGLMYINSHGVTKSDSEARRWLQKAADQGHSQAQKRLKKLSISGSDM